MLDRVKPRLRLSDSSLGSAILHMEESEEMNKSRTIRVWALQSGIDHSDFSAKAD
jgi:hypothetical protein